MAAEPRPRLRDEGTHRLVEALSVCPVLVFLGLLVWMVLAEATPKGEARFGRNQPVATPAPAFALERNPPVEKVLILVTASEEKAADIRGLLQAEATLRGLLRETSREAHVVAAGTADAALQIARAIQHDDALRPFAPEIELVVVE